MLEGECIYADAQVLCEIEVSCIVELNGRIVEINREVAVKASHECNDGLACGKVLLYGRLHSQVVEKGFFVYLFVEI